MFNRRGSITLGIISIIAISLITSIGRSIWHPVATKVTGGRSVETVITEIGPAAETRLSSHFKIAQVAFPPRTVTLLVMKRERKMELRANDPQGRSRLIHTYPLTATSGSEGPKLREGDRQIPEGFYSITHLNPNSSYHLSLKLNYPNYFDLAFAEKEGRTQPGSDIFIHGKAVSIGCIAIGDPAIEEIFTLVDRIGPKNCKVISSPHDPRQFELSVSQKQPEWLAGLYKAISKEFARHPTPSWPPSP